MIPVIIVATMIWITIGYRMLRREGGWLVMITDRRNTPRTWMALPSMYLCILLWPINRWVARRCFLLSITNLPKPKVEIEEYSSFRQGRGSKVEKLPDGEFLIDYDINSMYWEVMRPLDPKDKP